MDNERRGFLFGFPTAKSTKKVRSSSSSTWPAPKRGKTRALKKPSTIMKKKSPVKVPYVRHGQRSQKSRKERENLGRSVQMFLKCTHQAAHEGRHPPQACQMPSLLFGKSWALVLQTVGWIHLQVLEACLPLPYLAPQFPPNLLSP